MKHFLPALLAAAIVPALWAQTDPMIALAKRSAIVVLGTITKVNASEEPLLAPNKATVVIKIQTMFAGIELAGDQAGRTATVILSRPAEMKVGTRAYFFGNPRFIGKSLTFADEGEVVVMPSASAIVPPGLAVGVQAYKDAPIRARLALAEMVFRGKVESVKPLEGEVQGRKPGMRDEHDPEWQMAAVRVAVALRGTQAGATVAVIFPASRDIMWFNCPKLKPDDEFVFLAHRPQEDEMRLLRTDGILSYVQDQKAVVVSQPFDTMPVGDEKRVDTLLRTKEVE